MDDDENNLRSLACTSNAENLTDPDRLVDMIQIESSNNGFLIFDFEDAKTLRVRHRMVGTAIGTLPSSPAQNDSLSLPLLLFAEQVAVLLEYGYARLVRLRYAHATENDRNLYEDYFTEQKAHLTEATHKKKIEDQLRKAETIAKGRLAKKLKLEKSAPGAPAKSVRVSPDDVAAVSVTEEEIEAVRRELRLTKPPPLAEDAITIETWLTTPPLFSPTYDQIDFFDYPRTVQQRLRLTVFRDLWRKGYYVTPGLKFGCDFLVYPGDPSKFHAACMAICIKSEQSLTPLELAAYSRVASQVKKTVLICSVASDSDAPYYLSLNWWKG